MRCGFANLLLSVGVALCCAVGSGLGQSAASAPQASGSPPSDAVVTYVADGDTLYVQVASEPGRQRAVRLQGLDAPEICQDGGLLARQAVQERVLGQTVSITVQGTDDYGRELAFVYWRGQDLGRWLVEQGLAWAAGSQRSPYASEQRQAREHRKGLFAQPDPEPPWRFRRRHGSCRPAGTP